MTAQPSEPPGDPHFGRLIREQIRRRRLTIDELAETLGVHRSTLSRWLTGSVCPSPANLAALEEALGVRFVDDGGTFTVVDAGVDPAPEREAALAPHPQVVVIVASTAEAMHAALDRAGVPRAE